MCWHPGCRFPFFRGLVDVEASPAFLLLLLPCHRRWMLSLSSMQLPFSTLLHRHPSGHGRGWIGWFFNMYASPMPSCIVIQLDPCHPLGLGKPTRNLNPARETPFSKTSLGPPDAEFADLRGDRGWLCPSSTQRQTRQLLSVPLLSALGEVPSTPPQSGVARERRECSMQGQAEARHRVLPTRRSLAKQ